MNNPTGHDDCGPLPPQDPHFVDTIRDFPKYFPSDLSPDEWMDWFLSTHRGEWDTYVEKRKLFEDEHRQWQAKKAEIERKRREMARPKVFRAWVVLREKAWDVERAKWSAEEEAMLSEDALDAEVTYAVSLGPARKSKKKKGVVVVGAGTGAGASAPGPPESANRAPAGVLGSVGDVDPSSPSTTLAPGPTPTSKYPSPFALPPGPVPASISESAFSFVDDADEDGVTTAMDGLPSSMPPSPILTIDQRAPYTSGGVTPLNLDSCSLFDNLADALDPEEETRQRMMEEESVASDITVSQPVAVTDRVHRMLLMRAQLIQVKREMDALPEGTPETTRKPLESMVRKYERQLSRRYVAGVAMAELLDPSNEPDDGVILMDNKHPKQVETIIEEKLEVLLSPSTKSMTFSFQLAKKAKDAARQKQNVRRLLEEYGLFDYTIEDPLKKGLMTVNVAEEDFEAWVFSYRERTTRAEEFE